MRDIGRRIRRYRLSRYRPPDGTRLTGVPRWVWFLAVLWLAYVAFVSDHSLLRIWQLGRENERSREELEVVRGDISRLDRDLRDPEARRRVAEEALRRDGFARPDEIVYRVQGHRADSLRR